MNSSGVFSTSTLAILPDSQDNESNEIRLVLSKYALKWVDLNDYQKSQLNSLLNGTDCHDESCRDNGFKCYIESWLNPGNLSANTSTPSLCPFNFDGHICWPAQLPLERSLFSCKTVLGPEFVEQCRTVVPASYFDNFNAVRFCAINGEWSDRTNYSACSQFSDHCFNKFNALANASDADHPAELMDEETKRIVVYVFAGLAILSLVLLSISFFIFSYFKILHCSRNSIHKNLIAALVLQVVSLLVIMSPQISGDETVHQQAWLCKSFMFFAMYAGASSIMWTFVEGLYLSQRLALAVFKKEAPFRIYYLIGWGIPLVLVLVGTLLTECFPIVPADELAAQQMASDTCWRSIYVQPYHWIITGPCLAALGVNVIFLLLIIIVLVTKLQANNTVETVQVRKAIKATFILVPLLGISNLLFFANPNDNGAATKAYVIINLMLKGSQGIFVALIYCFLNSEVQMAIKKMFYRAALMRNPETSQSFRFGSIAPGETERRKSSTRTSTTLVSSAEMLRIHNLAKKRRSSTHVRFTNLPKYKCSMSRMSRSVTEDCYV